MYIHFDFLKKIIDLLNKKKTNKIILCIKH